MADGGCPNCGDGLTRIVGHGRRGDITECCGCRFSWTRIHFVSEPGRAAPKRKKGPKP